MTDNEKKMQEIIDKKNKDPKFIAWKKKQWNDLLLFGKAETKYKP